MLSIYQKEIKSFFNSLIGYVVICVFLLGISLYMWVFPNTIFDYGRADMSLLFQVTPYIFLFLIPAVTMKSFSEEKKGGTLELLLSKPITEWQLLLGKYFASLTLVGLALAPTIIYYISIYLLGNPVGNLDTAAIIGSYVGLICLAMAYTAIGILASSITENQIIAFFISMLICLFMYESFQYISELNGMSSWAIFINKIGFAHHYSSLSRGVIDSRDIIYFVGASIITLSFTKLILVSRKW